jgi:signal transduction histidine kinase/FixJ family two-component response regulator
MTLRILRVAIEHEQDVVLARQRARQIAAMLGFAAQDQTRIATAVSELARNIYEYAAKGKIEFALEGESAPQVLTVLVSDKGPGIPHIQTILDGEYRSPSGMGVGILGARRLLDQFDIETKANEGTKITLKKVMPADSSVITAERLGQLTANFAALPPNVTLHEVQLQNHELLSALAELKNRQEELIQLTRELESTNRGVVALYAELDEKADHLRRADEMKSRFLSNMSHEFRTPLSSIRALSKLLLDRVDGPLSPEQEKQVAFILKGSDDLSELVNDLLDLAKIEAGKTEIRPNEFDIADMFDTLKGMLRPLLVTDTVKLLFDIPRPLPIMQTDEAKLSQILRNFISNALKFTERGEVLVTAEQTTGTDVVKFSVKDTGLGIEKENQDLIFEEFSQVASHLQRGVKGTGLGLPLCKKLAHLLGGTISLESEMGAGSIFSVSIPVNYLPKADTVQSSLTFGEHRPDLIPVLIVEDHLETRLLYEKFLRNSDFNALVVTSIREAESVIHRSEPAVIILDLHLNGHSTWHWLAELKGDDHRKHIPIIVASETDDKRKATILGADAYFVKPLFREELLSMLHHLTRKANNTSEDVGTSDGHIHQSALLGNGERKTQ